MSFDNNTTLSLFQFHKGTIKTCWREEEFSWVFIFQFHKGTIKTKTDFNPQELAALFQFHKGTIKTFKVPQRKESFSSISIP